MSCRECDALTIEDFRKAKEILEKARPYERLAYVYPRWRFDRALKEGLIIEKGGRYWCADGGVIPPKANEFLEKYKQEESKNASQRDTEESTGIRRQEKEIDGSEA